ncbi:hypothetical protein C8R47DRAFT_1206638 [Mycena vitilis]|nr:hypothetical protein C8R47DRAFT_1206638 [Mycena vitilis]
MYNLDGTFACIPYNAPDVALQQAPPLIMGSDITAYTGQRAKLLVSFIKDRRTSFLVMTPDGHLLFAMKRDVNSHADTRAPHSCHEIVCLVINHERVMIESISPLRLDDRRFREAQDRALAKTNKWARDTDNEQIALLSSPFY